MEFFEFKKLEIQHIGGNKNGLCVLKKSLSKSLIIKKAIEIYMNEKYYYVFAVASHDLPKRKVHESVVIIMATH